jgi:pyrroline-5-carboxylate reductase
MKREEPRIGFIGSGNMAEAIIKGLISSGLASPARIIIADRQEARLVHMAGTYEVKVSNSNAEAARESDIVFIAVKPPDVPGVLREIAPELGNEDGARPEDATLVISIAAGVTTDDLLGALRGGGLAEPFVPIIRAMPNIPVTIGQGMTVLVPGAGAEARDVETARRLFESVGRALPVDDEGLFDAVTAISGSGPAYFFYFMEALLRAGEKAGLSDDTARALVLQTAAGAAEMAVKSGKGLEELRRMVTSPGGTTEAAIKVFASSDFEEIVEKAVKAAARRSRELSEGG